jgi:hypothetical protein
MSNIKRLFTRSTHDDAGEPIARGWIGDGDEAAFVDLDDGRIHALVRHDGYGKFEPTLYVSPRRAFWLWRAGQGSLRSLRPLPRCAMSLSEQRSMEDAKEAVEFMLWCRRKHFC